MDVLGALIALILLSPLLLVTAAAVAWADGAPVIFRQHRAGTGLIPFMVFKFRTMYRDADKRAGSWKRSDPRYQDNGGGCDPRILPGASQLRRYSLDELPQLINVLKGDMSLVGPRPLLLTQLSEDCAPADVMEARASVPPGITGLWQVSGRSDISFGRMMELDLEYVRGLSFSGDLAIILKTVVVVFRASGAA
jgi:lipopolysaccharide/colanic/teichoic acid biosynthesis glycosyltransferase